LLFAIINDSKGPTTEVLPAPMIICCTLERGTSALQRHKGRKEVHRIESNEQMNEQTKK
jgi:hypothetical protein